MASGPEECHVLQKLNSSGAHVVQQVPRTTLIIDSATGPYMDCILNFVKGHNGIVLEKADVRAYTCGTPAGGPSRRGANAVLIPYGVNDERARLVRQAHAIVRNIFAEASTEDGLFPLKLNINDHAKHSCNSVETRNFIRSFMEDFLSVNFGKTLQEYLTHLVDGMFLSDGYVHMWSENGRCEMLATTKTGVKQAVFVDKFTGVCHDTETGAALPPSDLVSPTHRPIFHIPARDDLHFDRHTRIRDVYKTSIAADGKASPLLYTFGGAAVTFQRAIAVTGSEANALTDLAKNGATKTLPVCIAEDDNTQYPLQTTDQVFDPALRYIVKLQNKQWAIVEYEHAQALYTSVPDLVPAC